MNLRRGYVVELELSLEPNHLDRSIVDIDTSTQITSHKLRPITLPGHGRNIVVIFYLHDAILDPLPSSGIQVVHIESIVVPQDNSFPIRIDTGSSEISAVVIIGVIKPIEKVPLGVVKIHLSVVACQHNVFTSSQTVRNSFIGDDFLQVVSLQVVHVDTAVVVTSQNIGRIVTDSHGNNVAFSFPDQLGLVILDVAHLDLAICMTVVNFVQSFAWPGLTGDTRAGGEPVAYCLLHTEVSPDFKHVNYVV